MTKRHMYWTTNSEWYHYEGLRRVVNDDAPDNVKEDYRLYLEDLKNPERQGY